MRPEQTWELHNAQLFGMITPIPAPRERGIHYFNAYFSKLHLRRP